VRVIAGALRGRRLKPVPGLATRPTADRVKEALFNVLGPLGGARVLDLYAGTGSLGIEALSRGAERAVLVESARQPLRVLRENLAGVGLTDRATVLPLGVERAAASLAKLGPFDLVLVDPPYADVFEAVTLVADLAVSSGVLAEDGVIVLEHAARDTPRDERLEQTDTRRYGDTALSFFRLLKGGAQR
jgi:16S rRNA (guanine966-N2)-methyltransferase